LRQYTSAVPLRFAVAGGMIWRADDDPVCCTAERTRNLVNSGRLITVQRQVSSSTKFRLCKISYELRVFTTTPRAIVQPPFRSFADAAINCTCHTHFLSLQHPHWIEFAASALCMRHRMLALFVDCIAFFLRWIRTTCSTITV